MRIKQSRCQLPSIKSLKISLPKSQPLNLKTLKLKTLKLNAPKLTRPSSGSRTRAIFYLRIFVLVGVLVFGHNNAHAHATTPTCRNVGAKSKNATIGSQVDGDLVTICLNSSLRKKLLNVAKPKAPVRVVVKPSTRPTKLPKVIVKRPKVAIPRVSTHPRPVQKTKPILRPKPRATSKSFADRAVFRPRTSQIEVAPGTSIRIGQIVELTTKPKRVFGNSKLLGHPVLVQFTPVALDWQFGDGQGSDAAVSRPQVAHAYLRNGTYPVRLRTTFVIAYRLASGKWLKDPDRIVLESSPVSIAVGDSASGSAKKVVLLTTP